MHQLHAAGHTTRIYLSNAAPDAALDLVKADLAEITNGFGYAAPIDTQNDMTETTGTATVTGISFTITAAGGSIGPFRWIVHMNDTPTTPADPLINWWEYGDTSITLLDGESLDVRFNAAAIGSPGTIFTLT